MSIHEFEGEMPNLNYSVWDADLEEFVQATWILSKLDFLNRFTLEERLAIRASTDIVAFDTMKLLTTNKYIGLK